MSHSYQRSLQEAQQQLEAARGALARDFAKAISNAGWTSALRDEHDVIALVNTITTMFEDRAFVDRLHAAADQARQQQPRVGRPSKRNPQ
jgi:predicted signal transduction protein with EAL and GGDEF domain